MAYIEGIMLLEEPMSQYKPYLNKVTAPSRKLRKSERNKVFQHNRTVAKTLAKKLKKAE